jgi:hypothetical protein
LVSVPLVLMPKSTCRTPPCLALQAHGGVGTTEPWRDNISTRIRQLMKLLEFGKSKFNLWDCTVLLTIPQLFSPCPGKAIPLFCSLELCARYILRIETSKYNKKPRFYFGTGRNNLAFYVRALSWRIYQVGCFSEKFFKYGSFSTFIDTATLKAHQHQRQDRYALYEVINDGS